MPTQTRLQWRSVSSDGPNTRPDCFAGPDGEEALEAAHAEGRAAWPGLELTVAELAAWLDERMESLADLEQLDIPALYLTCAVALGRPRAPAIFRDAYASDIDLALGRLSLDPDGRDEARQVVLDKLLTPGTEKLRSYAGRGSLSHWVRAVAVRQAISLGRKRGVLERVVGEPSGTAADDAPDPELAFLKSHYRAHFKEAFAAMMQDLPAADRTLLQLRFVDGLTLDQLARVRQQHRATVARHLARLRQSLLAEVREHLAQQAGLGPQRELESVLRIVQSNLELSLPRILGS